MIKKSLILLISFGLLLAACAPNPPRIAVGSDQIDFDDVVMGEVITQEINLENQGGELLEILSITTSCGCTTASVDRMSIPPGENATLVVELDSGAHDINDIGQLFRQVFIATNDPQQPEVVVDVTANVVSNLPEN